VADAGGSLILVGTELAIAVGLAIALLLLVVWDLTQAQHSILRTWPLLGHFRYLLELVGPELRQYIVTDNNSERPFSRDQRRWIYATSKGEDNRFGFGTDNDLDRAQNHVIVLPSVFAAAGPTPPAGASVPVGKVLGAARGRVKAFRQQSIVNVSGMSWGALSGPAVEALNRGCGLAVHRRGSDQPAPPARGRADLPDWLRLLRLPRLERIV
jgi:glutamate synthase domain-containing protein 2